MLNFIQGINVKYGPKLNPYEKCSLCGNDYLEQYINPHTSSISHLPVSCDITIYIESLVICTNCFYEIAMAVYDEYDLKSMTEIKRKERLGKNKDLYLKKSIPAKLHWTVLKRDNFTCLKCGSQGETSNDLHADHVVPEFLGGTTTMDNLQTLCRKCNFSKQTKTIDYRNVSSLVTREVNPAGAESMD